MCKVFKYNEVLDICANPYVFKNFNHEKTEKTPERSFSKEINNTENEIKHASSEAGKIVGSAREQADKIIRKAKSEADLMMNKATMDGYQSGLTAANEKINNLITELNLNAQELFKETKLKLDNTFHELEQDAVNISLDIAKKILDVELDRNDNAVIPVVKQAIQNIKSKTEAKVILQAEELKKLEETEAFQMLKKESAGKFQFASDGNMNKGDVLVQTDSGVIDAGISTQFINISNALLQKV